MLRLIDWIVCFALRTVLHTAVISCSSNIVSWNTHIIMFLIMISSAVLIAGIEGGCQEDLMKDKAFLDCNLGFLAVSSTIASDPLSICGEEAKAALACIFEYQKQCPELINTFGGVSQQMLDSQCGMISECAGATACIQSSMQAGEVALPASLVPYANVPFVLVPYFVGVICGPLKEFKMCFESIEGQCPDLDTMWQNNTEMMTMAMRKQFSNFPNIDQIKAIIKDDCPNVQAGFDTSSCLEQKLGSQAYLSCVAKVKGNSTRSALSCEAYDGVTMCLKTSLVPECGQDHYDTMLKFSRFFVHGLPKNCPTSASTTAHVSLLTLVLVAVTMLL